jgi:acyl phosphate:glycerol-3-phosphate acyltransferase
VNLALALLAAYLVGAIPMTLLVARVGAGIDLRTVGSGNLGATNLYRALGWKYAIPAALFDIAKGALPTVLLPPRLGTAAWLPLAIGAAAIVGHVFSVFVRFRGGKGVATAAGVVLGLAPIPLLISFAIWIVVLTLTGYVSLGSILGAVAFPVSAAALGTANPWVVPVGSALAAFIVLTHRQNIQRLLAGTENRFGRRREP